MENHFHPVLVYNNRPNTKDSELLSRYGEPSWNYQVIRFLDHTGKDIIPRKDGVWTVRGVAERMAEALSAAKRPVPDQVRELAEGGM